MSGGDWNPAQYERFREEQGVRYSHIIDPRTGWPVEGITSATVIEPDGSIADAAATAMVVAGVKEWHQGQTDGHSLCDAGG